VVEVVLPFSVGDKVGLIEPVYQAWIHLRGKVATVVAIHDKELRGSKMVRSKEKRNRGVALLLPCKGVMR
jgi:hypothetical protein